MEVGIRNPATREVTEGIPMWIYWSLQEGTLGVDPKLQVTNDGAMPPVIHVDTDAPLYSDEDGRLITDQLWGIYYKPDFHFGGVQGGAAPFIVDKPAADVSVDPYGPASPEFVVGAEFAEMWVSALAHCQERFSGTLPQFKKEPSGGIGAFTPDSFPVFDSHAGELLCHRRLQPWLQDDWCRRVGRPNDLWRQARAPRPVSLLTLCRGRPTPCLQQPLSVELNSCFKILLY